MYIVLSCCCFSFEDDAVDRSKGHRKKYRWNTKVLQISPDCKKKYTAYIEENIVSFIRKLLKVDIYLKTGGFHAILFLLKVIARVVCFMNFVV